VLQPEAQIIPEENVALGRSQIMEPLGELSLGEGFQPGQEKRIDRHAQDERYDE
jgi:hypothetical protein